MRKPCQRPLLLCETKLLSRRNAAPTFQITSRDLQRQAEAPTKVSLLRRLAGTGAFRIYPLLLILSLKTGEHLKVTTLLDPNIISSPVAGFLPFRSLLFMTQNFPNPLMRTSSPFTSLFLIISRRDPNSSADLVLGRSRSLRIEFMRWSLVRVMNRRSFEKDSFYLMSITVFIRGNYFQETFLSRKCISYTKIYSIFRIFSSLGNFICISFLNVRSKGFFWKWKRCVQHLQSEQPNPGTGTAALFR